MAKKRGADNEKDDLLVTYGENVQVMLDAGIIDQDTLRIRSVVSDFDVSKLDKYCEPLLYQAYYVAKTSKTSSHNILARKLGISRKLFDYYMENYPKFALVIQIGVSDCREDMKQGVVDALYKAALGQTVSEKSEVTENEYLGEDNQLVTTKTKVSVVNKYISPNVQAGLELMKRLDPAWVPQLNIDVNANIEQNLKVAEDINLVIDYDKLSPEALKELIGSAKNLQSRDYEKNKSEVPTKLVRKKAKGRKKSVVRLEKELDDVKKSAKQEADKLINKENKDGTGNQSSNKRAGRNKTARNDGGRKRKVSKKSSG